MKIFLVFCKERHSWDFIEGFLIHTVYKICLNKKYILHQERTDLSYLFNYSLGMKSLEGLESLLKFQKSKEAIYLN